MCTSIFDGLRQVLPEFHSAAEAAFDPKRSFFYRIQAVYPARESVTCRGQSGKGGQSGWSSNP
jgi:hypothetical protein